MAGIIREIDSLGRAVIPMEFRRQLGLKNNSKIEIINNGIEVIIRKPVSNCTICGKEKEVMYKVKSKSLCKDCKKIIETI